MRIAIIPARGGSERIPRKNIKFFCGKPIIAYSIIAAQESGLFDRIIVSTDDTEIANVVKMYGAEVPFVRPAELSDDFSTTVEVINHAIRALQEKNDIRHVCCIYATAPFITVKDLQAGYNKLIECNAEYVFSATSFSFPIQRSFRLLENDSIEMFEPGNYLTRSQDLEEAYHDAGQFYWGRVESFLEEKQFFSLNSRVVHIPRYRVQDIDTDSDWEHAELLFKILQQENI